MENEIWKSIPSLPEYEASSFGRVRCIPFEGRTRSGGVRMYGGQPSTGVWRKDVKRYAILFRGKNYKVARLVCEAFNGPPPDKKAVCMHMDEDSRNNRPENLQWETQKQNMNAPGFLEHCATARRGFKGNVLPDEKVREIRARSGEVQAALAREYGVSACQISNIIAGRARPNA